MSLSFDLLSSATPEFTQDNKKGKNKSVIIVEKWLFNMRVANRVVWKLRL